MRTGKALKSAVEWLLNLLCVAGKRPDETVPMGDYMKRNLSLLIVALGGIFSLAQASASDTQQKCDLEAYKGPAYMGSKHLYFRGTPEFKTVERWDDLAVDLSIIPTNGYTLVEELVFTGDVKGTLDAGTLFEFINTTQGLACTVIFGGKNRPYMCLKDEDGDQKFDTGILSKSRYSKDTEVVAISRPEIFRKNIDIAYEAKEINDLPNFTLVYGSGIQVRKATKKYIKISYGNTITAKTRMDEKTRKRCGEICMAFNGDFTEVKVFANDLKPVQFGGVTVNFALASDGNIMVSTTGGFAPTPIVRTCTGDEVATPGTRLNRNFQLYDLK